MKYTLWQQKVGAPWRAGYNPIRETFTFDDYEPTYIDGETMPFREFYGNLNDIAETFHQFLKKEYFPKDFKGRELKMGDLMYLDDGRVFYYEVMQFPLVDEKKITKTRNGEDK